ncbi:colicin immunity protein [Paraburkholderia guartelaensis]|uniref:colicin immunity protein n=1 Tax=Paraburkholderia guartelaensis TaxID=2546446 RepID=UPI002AB7B509|nr:colicin immunity protein [Paraburkholderia guartelaensis]
MKLTTEAANDVCKKAAAHGLLVARIEGGIWHAPGFEARVDCIWDGEDPPTTSNAAIENNRRAAAFICEESGEHDTFILTTLRYLA